jgi:hypothetical protein
LNSGCGTTWRWLKPVELRYWRGQLDGLDNGIGRFWGYDLTSRYPAAHPLGDWPTGIRLREA